MPVIKAAVNEEYSGAPTEVSGKIPQWLNGTLVRNGPTDISIDGKSPSHWFDGLGMLHAFTFNEGKVSYSNRYLRSEAFDAVFKDGSLNYVGFDCDPCRTIFSKFFTMLFPFKQNEIHNANVNVGKLADQYVAYTETPLPVRFDKATLDTLGVFDFDDKLPKRNCFESAHPHRDWEKGYTYNYIVDFGKQSYYLLYKIKDGSSQRELVAKVPVDKPSYMHSYALTQNYVIFAQYPFVANPLSFILQNKPFIQNYSWVPNQNTKFLVINRHTGAVEGDYDAKPFFSFHHANAFEGKNGDIYLDIVTYPDAQEITDLSTYHAKINANLENARTKLVRFKLSEREQTLTSKEVFVGPIEFPRVHEEKFEGKPYQFLYAIDPRDPLSETDVRPIYKIDMETAKIIKWETPGSFPGEPVFVPRPDGTTEDDGVVMTIVIDAQKNNSYLLILDAASFQELGRAGAPLRIPGGLHARFFKD